MAEVAVKTIMQRIFLLLGAVLACVSGEVVLVLLWSCS
jgi:hypothetical protein